MERLIYDIIESLQIIFGYLLMYSIIKILLYFIDDIYILAFFGICLVILEINPHPTSKLNPFAFACDYRFGKDKW